MISKFPSPHLNNVLKPQKNGRKERKSEIIAGRLGETGAPFKKAKSTELGHHPERLLTGQQEEELKKRGARKKQTEIAKLEKRKGGRHTLWRKSREVKSYVR